MSAIVVVVAGNWGHALFQETLIQPWVPFCVAFVFASVTFRMYPKWSLLTTSSGKWTNVICHLLCMGCVGYFLFMASNFYMRNSENQRIVTVRILDKYSEVKEKPQRVGRHRVRTTKVAEYYIEIALDGGKSKTLDVSRDLYRETNGDSITITLERGFLGFWVMPYI